MIAGNRNRGLTALVWLGCALVAGWTAPAAAQDGGEGADGASELSFNIWEIRVGGNSVLDAPTIEALVYPHLGRDKTIEDVEAAQEALATAYRDAGYTAASVTIPEQTVDSGIVRLEVAEGRLGRLRVREARYVSGRDVMSEMTSLSPGEAISFSGLQEDLVAVNARSPDRTVTPVIRAGRDPGELDVELRVEDQLPMHAMFDLNDRFTADTAELRASASLSYDNLFQRFHSVSLQYTTAPERREDSEVWALTYLWRLRDNPGILAFYAVDTSSDVFTVGDLNVLGDARIYGFRFVRPLEAAGSMFHSFTVGADSKDFTETIGDELNTPIKYTHLTGNYSVGWNLENYRASYDLGLGLGIRALGNDVQEFEDKRFNAKPNYYYFRLNTEHLIRGWQGIGFYGRLSGQYTPEPLINNEQFTVGGATSVRGYLEAERLADYGAFGNIEVRSPNFGPVIGSWVDTLYLHAFYDAAQLGLNDSLPGQDPNFELYSTGIGLRFMSDFGLLAAVDYAHPLRDSTNVQAGDERFHFQLKWSF